jgi:chorismate-pyruvate lyase
MPMMRLELASVERLSPLQQVLVKTTGTVTTLLEAFAGETIRVAKLNQGYEEWDGRDPRLDLDIGRPVLRRTVLLQGADSGRNFLYASSFMVPERLPQPVIDGLLRTDTPVGTLLIQDRVETFREVLSVERESAASCAVHFGIDPGDDMISRTYRVCARQRPIMLITEKFPATTFAPLG